MLHFEVNWLAIILATIASMALGMGWYMAFAKPWMAAVNKTMDDIKSGSSATPFIWAGIAQFVMAYFIAVLTPRLMGSVSVYDGALVGVHMWLGFVITAMVINHRYQDQKWMLTVIDGGYLLGVLIVQGVVIGLLA